MKSRWDLIVNELSLKQYVKLMGKSSKYVELAVMVKRISKSKKIHKLADEIIVMGLVQDFPNMFPDYSGDGQPGQQS